MVDHIHVEAPRHMHRLDVAQAVVGSHVLLKAEQLPGATVWYRDKPLRELHERIFKRYQKMYRAMLQELREYIEQEIVGQSLTKAEINVPPRPLTPEQLEALRDIVERHHDAFVAHIVDPSALPPEALQRLHEAGVVTDNEVTMIREAYQYGQALGRTPTPASKRQIEGLGYRQWKKLPTPPLSPVEARAVDFAQHSAATRIRGLGNRVAEDFTTRAIESDRQLRRRFETTTREKLSENIERRESWRKLWSEMGHATGDWSRDFARIAATEKMDAMIEGQARSIVANSGNEPDEVRVAKQPNPDACPDCIKHYTKNGVPRIFTMAELMANGTNVGRKRSEWLPTLGPLHPWCACELIEVPSGWGFDEDGDLIPLALKRADFEWNLRKAETRRNKILLYSSGHDGISVRVSDPLVRQQVEEVVSRTPVELFTRATGLTLITTDHRRPQNPLDDNDYAYWAGNEIRLQQTIPPNKVKRVLEHEIGHSLNTWLVTTLGNVERVKHWHDRLWEISKREGWVSSYAKHEPIENAAEVSRLYLYYKPMLRDQFPRQFAFCHRYYKDLFSEKRAA